MRGGREENDEPGDNCNPFPDVLVFNWGNVITMHGAGF